jgi:branched-chain amino acid transport system ATP-binding protein
MMILNTSNLSASYGSGQVLESVSLAVPVGAVVGIVGPNGHGKSTLLRAISGLMPVQQGVILFEGNDISRLAPEKIAQLGIVHVPQGDLVYKNMTVLENLLIGGYTNDNREETLAQLADVYAVFPKLRERATQIASSLSGGERRMLGIGRGLMMKKMKLLLLDEPSLGLAPIVIDQIYGAIAHLKSSGLTIVIVEENVSRISAIADELSLLNHGNIIWTGAPEELADNRQLIETYLGT